MKQAMIGAAAQGQKEIEPQQAVLCPQSLRVLLFIFILFSLAGCAHQRGECQKYLYRWNPQWSDGCSHSDDVNADVRACCVEHDAKYYYGGPADARLRADLNLYLCMVAAGTPEVTALIYFEGVREFGGPEFQEPEVSWGFGHHVFRYCSKPARAEKEKQTE
jgi:hypothetical protein